MTLVTPMSYNTSTGVPINVYTGTDRAPEEAHMKKTTKPSSQTFRGTPGGSLPRKRVPLPCASHKPAPARHPDAIERLRRSQT